MTILNRRAYIASMAVVFFLGVWLRLRYLLTHHLWNDEISSMRVLDMGWSELVDWFSLVEPHPPLSPCGTQTRRRNDVWAVIP